VTSCLAQKLQGVLNCCPWIPRGGSKEGTEPWAVHVHLYCTCLVWGTASAVTSKPCRAVTSPPNPSSSWKQNTGLVTVLEDVTSERVLSQNQTDQNQKFWSYLCFAKGYKSTRNRWNICWFPPNPHPPRWSATSQAEMQHHSMPFRVCEEDIRPSTLWSKPDVKPAFRFSLVTHFLQTVEHFGLGSPDLTDWFCNDTMDQGGAQQGTRLGRAVAGTGRSCRVGSHLVPPTSWSLGVIHAEHKVKPSTGGPRSPRGTRARDTFRLQWRRGFKQCTGTCSIGADARCYSDALHRTAHCNTRAWSLLTQETSDRDRQNISKYNDTTIQG
jgi:hypothetical protein